MNDVDDFLGIVRDQLGLPVTEADLRADLPTVPGWDSVHLLTLCGLLERATGRSVSLPDVLLAPTLADIYEVVVAA